MTSNLAQHEIADEAERLRSEAAGRGEVEKTSSVDFFGKSFKDEIIYPILRHHFKRDEFLGRIDEMLYFLPFSKHELHQIVTKELDQWAQKVKLYNIPFN